MARHGRGTDVEALKTELATGEGPIAAAAAKEATCDDVDVCMPIPFPLSSTLLTIAHRSLPSLHCSRARLPSDVACPVLPHCAASERDTTLT